MPVFFSLSSFLRRLTSFSACFFSRRATLTDETVTSPSSARTLAGAAIKNIRFRRIFAVNSRAFSASVLGVLLLFLAFQNYGDYFLRYTKSYSFAEVTGQSLFVRQMNARVQAEGRPIPFYYDVGTHLIYWGHGDNRFLNHGTPGTERVPSSRTSA